MAHFAKIEEGIVVDVIVSEQDYINRKEGTWVQCSYNTRGGVHYGNDGQPDGGVALRGNYPSIDDVYDSDNDAFYCKKPYPSWTLSETTWLWEAPVEMPVVAGESFTWDESNQEWVQLS
jgi:hypothetical protein